MSKEVMSFGEWMMKYVFKKEGMLITDAKGWTDVYIRYQVYLGERRGDIVIKHNGGNNHARVQLGELNK